MVYHAWCRNPVSKQDWGDAHLINAAMDIHADDPEFGYRLIADELIHATGFTVAGTECNTYAPCRGFPQQSSSALGLARRPAPRFMMTW